MNVNLITNNIVDDEAISYRAFLIQSVEFLKPPKNDEKIRVAATCFMIALGHYSAIIVLLCNHHPSSAFALLRVVFESYVRGQWIAHCASEIEVTSFLKNKELPKINVLIERLEKTDSFKKQVLSKIKKCSWKAMCAYTHTGSLQVLCWNTSEAICPSYSYDEVRELLSFTETIGAHAVYGIACLAKDERIAEEVLARHRARHSLESAGS